MIDTEALEADLAALESARQALLTGTQVKSVGYGDTRVEYTPATLPALEAAITTKKALLGRCRRRSIRIAF